MEEKLKSAFRNAEKGRSCAQAVFVAYADSMGLDSHTAARIMEGFGEGIGGLQETCGVLVAVTAVVSYYFSQGETGNKENRQLVYQKVRQAAAMFQREYGGLTCREALQGEPASPFRCGMKIKDAVLIIERLIREVEEKENTI